jgi:hypothetical protein
VEAVPGLPAAAAGFERGDLVVDVDGTPIHDFEELRAHVRSPSGTKRITVLRGTSRTTLEVTPDAEGRIGVVAIGAQLPIGAGEVLGLTVQPFRVLGESARLLFRWATGAPDAVSISLGTAQPPAYFRGTKAQWISLALAQVGSLMWPALVLFVGLIAWRQERVLSRHRTQGVTAEG